MWSNSQSRPYIQTVTNIHKTSVWDLKFLPREQCSSNKYAENIYNPITYFPTETYFPSQVISKFHSNYILNPLGFFFLLSATSLLVLAKLPKCGKLIKSYNYGRTSSRAWKWNSLAEQLWKRPCHSVSQEHAISRIM